jgi:hypothetical protein
MNHNPGHESKILPGFHVVKDVKWDCSRSSSTKCRALIHTRALVPRVLILCIITSGMGPPTVGGISVFWNAPYSVRTIPPQVSGSAPSSIMLHNAFPIVHYTLCPWLTGCNTLLPRHYPKHKALVEKINVLGGHVIMWNFSTTKWADVLFYGMPHFFFSPTKYHRTKILKKNSTGASG